MLTAVLGKTEQAAAGAGWAIMLPLMMLGGGMIPLFLLPSWMSNAGSVSPVKWATLAFLRRLGVRQFLKYVARYAGK